MQALYAAGFPEGCDDTAGLQHQADNTNQRTDATRRANADALAGQHSFRSEIGEAHLACSQP